LRLAFQQDELYRRCQWANTTPEADFRWIDASRDETLTQDASDKRELTVSVWCAGADPGARSGPSEANICRHQEKGWDETNDGR
jgi:hypothetical protein